MHVLLHAMCVSAELAGSCLRWPFRQLLGRGSLPEKREIVSFAVYTYIDSVNYHCNNIYKC